MPNPNNNGKRRSNHKIVAKRRKKNPNPNPKLLNNVKHGHNNKKRMMANLNHPKVVLRVNKTTTVAMKKTPYHLLLLQRRLNQPRKNLSKEQKKRLRKNPKNNKLLHRHHNNKRKKIQAATILLHRRLVLVLIQSRHHRLARNQNHPKLDLNHHLHHLVLIRMQNKFVCKKNKMRSQNFFRVFSCANIIKTPCVHTRKKISLEKKITTHTNNETSGLHEQ